MIPEPIRYFITIIIISYVLFAFSMNILRKRSLRINNKLLFIKSKIVIDDYIKWWLMVFITIGSIILFIFCWLCKITGQTLGKGSEVTGVDWIVRDFLGILPWFIWGCILAGFVIKYLKYGRFRLPKTMLGTGIFASFLPLCSCAGVPLAYGMMCSKKIPFRSIIVFLIIVPVLSPVGMILAIGHIGWKYLLLEIIAIFIFAIITGIIIERITGLKNLDAERTYYNSCIGCKSSNLLNDKDSVFLIAWNQLIYLSKYIFLGLLLGALVASIITPIWILRFFGSDGNIFGCIPGLILMVLIGIPIFICSGEDVLILAPLLAQGLPLGNAIAFAIVGNAICVSSFPVLNATFGKRVTLLLIGAFFIGGITIGLIINLILS